jgi:hypothetical protein
VNQVTEMLMPPSDKIAPGKPTLTRRIVRFTTIEHATQEATSTECPRDTHADAQSTSSPV